MPLPDIGYDEDDGGSGQKAQFNCLTESAIKQGLYKNLNDKINHDSELNVQSKFSNLTGGYNSLKEKSYILWIQVKKQGAQRPRNDEDVDMNDGDAGGKSAVTEKFNIIVLTSIPLDDKMFKDVIHDTVKTCVDNQLNLFRDVKKEIKKEEKTDEERHEVNKKDDTNVMHKCNESDMMVMTNQVVACANTDFLTYLTCNHSPTLYIHPLSSCDK